MKGSNTHMNNSTKIDMEKWNRAEPFREFIHMRTSIYDMTVRMDVTNLVKYCKTLGESFFVKFQTRSAVAVNTCCMV